MLRRHVTLGFSLLGIALSVFIYARAADFPLIYDDFTALKQNASIRTLSPITVPLTPPQDTPMSVRPLANLSLAVNYSVDELEPRGYRVVNLTLHVLTALLLYGVLRRAAAAVRGTGEPTGGHDLFAAAVTLLWLAHPLNTEAVVYITQRTELMVSLFYVFTLYAAMRGWEENHGDGVKPRWGDAEKAADPSSTNHHTAWYVLAVIACAAGMASKEVMVSAPLFVLLYDRTLVSGSFGKALKQSKGLYIGLAATWGVLAFLMATQTRGQTAGFNVGVSPMTYLQTQAGVILWYLRLCFWPSPLAITHPARFVERFTDALPALLAVAALGVGTIWALARKSWLGLAGALFFLVLAPSSSIVPIVTEVVAERRMYLPSFAVLTLIFGGAFWLLDLGRQHESAGGGTSTKPRLAGALFVAMIALTGIFSVASLRRVEAYSDPVRIWADADAKFPRNMVAMHNLATTLFDAGRYKEAREKVREALAMEPGNWRAHRLLGQVLFRENDLRGAEIELREAVRLNPADGPTRDALGQVLLTRGRNEMSEATTTQPAAVTFEAIDAFRKAVELDPLDAGVHQNLALALSDAWRFAEAELEFKEALRLRPNFPEAYVNLGNTAAIRGRFEEAAGYFHKANQLAPMDAKTWVKKGMALERLHRLAEAADVYRMALKIEPNNASIHNRLGLVLAQAGNLAGAAAEFEAAVKLQPDDAEARENLKKAQAALNRPNK